jgi:hypothetical protein
MDWEYIAATFAQDIEFTHASREEMFDALSCLEHEIGLKGIQETKAQISNSSALDRMIEYAKCLQVADKIQGNSKLKQKLRAGYLTNECQEAISEALTAERLITIGAIVQYEPQLPGTTKRPDLVGSWDTRSIAFEVVFPSLSVSDIDENRKQCALLSQCNELLTSGTLNIYFTKVNIDPGTVDAVIEAVKSLSDDPTHIYELDLPGGVYLKYDPVVNKMLVPALENYPREENANAFPLTDVAAYHEAKSRLKILLPMHLEATFKAVPQVGSHFPIIVLIIRVYRPVIDPRAFSKVDKEYEQLPPGIAGVVVIDMSRTSMMVRPEPWAKDIFGSFGPELYPKMSAVWLRSGQPVPGWKWEEYLIINQYATTELPADIGGQLLPGAESFDLS